MRRSLFALFVLASSCSALVACGGDEASPIPSRSPKTNGSDQPAGSTEPNATAATPAPSCAGVADAKQISNDATAADVQLVDGAIVFRAGTKIIRAAKDGTGQVAVYESAAMVRSHLADGLIFTIEDPEPPNAVVKVTTVDDPNAADPAKLVLNGAAIPTNWNAGGSYFIGAERDAVYAVGDEQTGEVIYELSRTAPALKALATVTDGLSSTQIANGGLWYVRDRSRVFQIPIAALDPNNPDEKGQGEPREIFGSTANTCALAVGQDATFCSAGAFVERRDLSGANPKTLFEANASKVAAPFGGAVWFGGTLYVRTSAPDATMGHAIRALKAAGTGVEEKIVACGRGAIGEVAVDEDMVVWSEAGKGVFAAPR